MSQLKTSAKWKTAIIIGLLALTACQQMSKSSGPAVTITGEIKGAGNVMIRLSELDVKAIKLIDSVRIGKDGKFSFEFVPRGSSFYLLKLSPAQKLVLVADSGDNIHIEADAARFLSTARIEGSPPSDWLLDFERFSSRNEARSDSLAAIFLSSRSDPGFAGIRQSLDSLYDEIVRQQKRYMQKFIDLHPSSLASLIVLNHKFGPNLIFIEEKDAPYYIRVDSGLMANFPGNKHALDHHGRVAAIVKMQKQRQATDSSLMPGNPAPEVRLSNKEGLQISLSSLKGKVVLIYFWTAMDAPSRMFIRKLIPLYQANKAKGFEIYGVALEPNEALWLNALKLDQPGGIQVNAAGGVESSVAALFGIKMLPEAILLDRQGKIIMRKISFDQLQHKLPKVCN